MRILLSLKKKVAVRDSVLAPDGNFNFRKQEC
jgi:hypothetical protein